MHTAIPFVLGSGLFVLVGAWLGEILAKAEEEARSMFGERRLPYGSDRP
jgi:hypothetical protein